MPFGGCVDISVRKQGPAQVIRLHGNLTLGDAVNSFSHATEELLKTMRRVLDMDLAA